MHRHNYAVSTGRHILAAATIRLTIGDMSILFFSDLGPLGSATMLDPAIVRRTDYLVVESTYGDRKHETADPENVIADIVTRTASRGGTVMMPAFAVSRTKTSLFHPGQLKRAGGRPDIPVFLDSPMAIDASETLCRHLDEHRLSEAQCRTSCGVARYVQEASDSKARGVNTMPKIIIFGER